MKKILFSLLLMTASLPAMEVVAMHGQSPLIQFRFVFRCGSVNDPKGKEGNAALLSELLSDSGSKAMTYQQILDAFYPMAAGFGTQVDKEMIVFEGSTHVDNLEEYYSIVKSLLLTPGWREDDLKRVRDNHMKSISVSLRVNNDEELGKEVLYSLLYKDHPYGHYSGGRLSVIEKLTMADLEGFYKEHFNQANLVIGVAGNYPKDFTERLKKDFSALPAGKPSTVKLPAPPQLNQTQLTIVDKKTRAVAYSIGFPIEVYRGHPDYPALLVANTWFGPHRTSGGNLYQRMREIRGLNYGDYSYIEYFPRGMFQFEPDPNLVRHSQIFQIWIRPVEPPTAHFALRLALFELDKLATQGITEQQFNATRDFLLRNVMLLMKTKSAELGYAIDSKIYGIPEYTGYIRDALGKMKYEDVQKAIRKHIRKDRLQIVAVSDNAEELRKSLLTDEPSPMKYNAPKPEPIMEEDKAVSTRKLGLKPEQIAILPVDQVFQ